MIAGGNYSIIYHWTARITGRFPRQRALLFRNEYYFDSQNRRTRLWVRRFCICGVRF